MKTVWSEAGILCRIKPISMVWFLRYPMQKLVLLIIFLLALLIFRFHTFYASHPQYAAGQKVSLDVTLQEEPELSNKGQNFSIKTSTNQIIFVKTSVSPRLYYGEAITIAGIIKESKSTRGSFLTLYFPQVLVRGDSDNVILRAAYGLRQKGKRLFEKTLPPTSASLLSGIVFGAKEHYSSDFKDSLRATGVLHVIAASGTNVTFIAAFLLYTLGYFLRRQTAIVVSVCGIAFYAVLAGLDPPIIRAAIMGTLVFTASLLGRQSVALFFIFVSAYVMLLWNTAFLQDVGFQLSFAATLGILLLGDLKLAWLDRLGGFGKVINESLVTTFAAEAATMPILLSVFGSLGILSLPVNALVLWTVPIVMTLGGLSVLVAFIFEPLGKLLLFCSLPFLLFFEAVVSFFGGLGWNFQVDSFPWQLSVGYYLMLGAIIITVKRKVKQL